MTKTSEVRGMSKFTVTLSTTYHGLQGLHLKSLKSDIPTTEDRRLEACDVAQKIQNGERADSSFQLGAVIGYAIRTSYPQVVIELLFSAGCGTVASAASNDRAFRSGLEAGLGEVANSAQFTSSLLNSATWRDVLSYIAAFGQGDATAKVLNLGHAMSWLNS